MKYRNILAAAVFVGIAVCPFVGQGQEQFKGYSLERYPTSGDTIYLLHVNVHGGWFIRAFDTVAKRVSYVNGTAGVTPYSEAVANYVTWGTAGASNFGNYKERFQ